MIYFIIMLDLTAYPLSPIDYGNIYNDYWNNELNCIIIQHHVRLGITGAVLLLSNNITRSSHTRKNVLIISWKFKHLMRYLRHHLKIIYMYMYFSHALDPLFLKVHQLVCPRKMNKTHQDK